MSLSKQEVETIRNLALNSSYPDKKIQLDLIDIIEHQQKENDRLNMSLKQYVSYLIYIVNVRFRNGKMSFFRGIKECLRCHHIYNLGSTNEQFEEWRKKKYVKGAM